MKNESQGQCPRGWRDGSFTEKIWAPVPTRYPSSRPSPGMVAPGLVPWHKALTSAAHLLPPPLESLPVLFQIFLSPTTVGAE